MTFSLIYQETVLAVLNDKYVNNLEKAEKVFSTNYFTTMLAHNYDELKSEEIDEETKDAYYENNRLLIRSYNRLTAKDFLNQYNLRVIENGDI